MRSTKKDQEKKQSLKLYSGIKTFTPLDRIKASIRKSLTVTPAGIHVKKAEEHNGGKVELSPTANKANNDKPSYQESDRKGFTYFARFFCFLIVTITRLVLMSLKHKGLQGGKN